MGGVDQATTSAAIGAAVMIVDGQMVAPIRSVRNLGVFIDSDHYADAVHGCMIKWSRVVSPCFAISPSSAGSTVVSGHDDSDVGRCA